MKYILPLISVIILLIIVGAGAFYLGQKTLKTNNSFPAQASNTQVTPTLTSTPAQSQPEITSYEAGGILVFKAYTLNTPTGWIGIKKKSENIDNLTLTKSTYKIVISQSAGGGGGCTYPGEAPQEMAQSFSSFVEITNPNGYLFRRGPAQGSPGAWTVCEKRQGSFGFPTTFGNITITAPLAPDNIIMTKIDSILASLKAK